MPADAPESKRPLTFTIAPNGAFEALKRRVLRAHQAAWTTLQALQHPVPNTADLPGSWFLHPWIAAQGLSEEERRRRACAWVLGHALTDCIEGIQDLLTETFKIYAFLALPQDGVRPSDVHDALERGPAKFRRLGLRDKQTRLLTTFGASPVPTREWEHIKSINNVRNCLVHSGGLVTKAYAVNDGVLRLVYHDMSFTVANADESETRVWVNPEHVKGSALDLAAVGIYGKPLRRLAIEPREYVYRVGETIQLAPAQFSWIVENVMQFGKAVVRGIVSHMKARGCDMKTIDPAQVAETVSGPELPFEGE